MRGIASLIGALVIATAGCSSPTDVGSRDAGPDAAVAPDASSEVDVGPLDARADAPDGAIADAIAGDAGASSDAGTSDASSADAGASGDASAGDASSADAGSASDAGRDAGGGDDAAMCTPYCDPVTGSYFVCIGGTLQCMCGPCAGGALPCC